ncbi:hypothetical protein HanHA300_Chr12g0440461 [Helianthus annuus]|nr:hypothetical protein HanHA300_Chr12g0440461 [Helianthus annuus]KAJ0505006.1 hypothetical protein HanHA89_Chr12g0465571 [Helianthus annuus]KAJ0674689.1 hypothetical protein HanLR1_Chr12g0442691 [Helianthus annuus]
MSALMECKAILDPTSLQLLTPKEAEKQFFFPRLGKGNIHVRSSSSQFSHQTTWGFIKTSIIITAAEEIIIVAGDHHQHRSRGSSSSSQQTGRLGSIKLSN